MSCQQRLLSLAKIQRFFTQDGPVTAGINCLLRMGVAFQHALVERFAERNWQKKLMPEFINNKSGESSKVDRITA